MQGSHVMPLFAQILIFIMDLDFQIYTTKTMLCVCVFGLFNRLQNVAHIFRIDEISELRLNAMTMTGEAEQDKSGERELKKNALRLNCMRNGIVTMSMPINFSPSKYITYALLIYSIQNYLQILRPTTTIITTPHPHSNDVRACLLHFDEHTTDLPSTFTHCQIESYNKWVILTTQRDE